MHVGAHCRQLVPFTGDSVARARAALFDVNPTCTGTPNRLPQLYLAVFTDSRAAFRVHVNQPLSLIPSALEKRVSTFSFPA